MNWRLIYTEQYQKRAAKFIRHHPDLEKTYGKALALLEANPYHPSLRLHALKGRLQGLHSISINLSFRVTIEVIITDKEIILINVGDHDQAY